MQEAGVSIAQVLGSFALVIALLLGFAYLLKVLAAKNFMQRFARASRLKVVDSLAIDAKHKVVIVQCDAREHLLVLSPESQCHIESFAAKELPHAS